MTLVVLGKGIMLCRISESCFMLKVNIAFFKFSDNLNELEKLVTSLFNTVANRNVKKLVYPFMHHPWGVEELNHKIYIVPLKNDKKVLRLTFPVPDVREYYKTAVSSCNCIKIFSNISVGNSDLVSK